MVFGSRDDQVMVACCSVHCETHHRANMACQLPNGLKPNQKRGGGIIVTTYLREEVLFNQTENAKTQTKQRTKCSHTLKLQADQSSPSAHLTKPQDRKNTHGHPPVPYLISHMTFCEMLSDILPSAFPNPLSARCFGITAPICTQPAWQHDGICSQAGEYQLLPSPRFQFSL